MYGAAESLISVAPSAGEVLAAQAALPLLHTRVL